MPFSMKTVPAPLPSAQHTSLRAASPVNDIKPASSPSGRRSHVTTIMPRGPVSQSKRTAGRPCVMASASVLENSSKRELITWGPARSCHALNSGARPARKTRHGSSSFNHDLRVNTNSLHPIPPAQVRNCRRSNPFPRYVAKISSGLATSNGYPPIQSIKLCQWLIPRRLFLE